MLLDSVSRHDKNKMVNTFRLAKEITILSKSLPFDYNSSMYICVDEENIQKLQILIIPSDGTPYSNGCFLFHMYIPSTYPNKPPNVKLITTGNNSVRFNPNLYNCGKVCLSLLGTWSGSQSESWNPETSTILQVLISIQSLIFIDKPYFNEPGYEKTINTVSGKKHSDDYNINIQYNTVTWAMINMINNPPKEFSDIIKIHFKLKKEEIKKEVFKWFSEMNNGKAEAFKKKYDELVLLLDLL
jgi:baculoviral IAP repeat-containing protein 6